jgi:hypothetical protein
MDLKDFVATTLQQIVEGVAQAAPAVSALGGAVSPAFYPKGDATHGFLGTAKSGDSEPVYAVSFDVAVVVGSAAGIEGGGKLQVASIFSVGGKASTNDKEETTSRLKFMVPLLLPTDVQSAGAAKQSRQREDRAARGGTHMSA